MAVIYKQLILNFLLIKAKSLHFNHILIVSCKIHCDGVKKKNLQQLSLFLTKYGFPVTLAALIWLCWHMFSNNASDLGMLVLLSWQLEGGAYISLVTLFWNLCSITCKGGNKRHKCSAKDHHYLSDLRLLRLNLLDHEKRNWQHGESGRSELVLWMWQSFLIVKKKDLLGVTCFP